MAEKPPILSERQFEDWCKAHQKQVWDRFEAQRDADAAYYERLIEQAKEDAELQRVRIKELNLELEQAKAEVAREIFEWVRSKRKTTSDYTHYYWDFSIGDLESFESKYTGGQK